MGLFKRANGIFTSSEEETLKVVLKTHYPDCKLIKQEIRCIAHPYLVPNGEFYPQCYMANSC